MYIIGEQTFKTQKEIKNYVNLLFEKNGFCKANPSTHIFLLELIKRHPEYERKIGVGIDFFTILQNPISRVKSFHLTLTRTDGSMDGISFNTCIKGTEPTTKTQTLTSMRYAIHNDIQMFKNQAEHKCNHCGLQYLKFDCDHYGMEFKEISESFIKLNGLCNTFSSESIFTCFGDQKYKKEWIKYHNLKAQLQLLCVECHKNKKKTGDK